MKEQIEEMAKIIGGSEIYEHEDYLEAKHKAEQLYNAGYRKQSEGEWIRQEDGTHYCSNCGHDATSTHDGTEVCGIACPFCGARMKGDEGK